MAGNNFGTSGYGIGDAKGGVALAKMAYSNPYSAIAAFLAGAAASNIGGAIDSSHENNRKIVTQDRPDINAEHSSPFGVADTMGSQMFPGAEKMLSANTKPLEVAPGSIAQQNLNVDSGQPIFSSKMTDYLNYMKYRGGY